MYANKIKKCKQDLKEFVVFINNHVSHFRQLCPELYEKDTHDRLKKLIRVWNIKNMDEMLLWDIKEHQHFISIAINKCCIKIPLWEVYILSTQQLRAEITIKSEIVTLDSKGKQVREEHGFSMGRSILLGDSYDRYIEDRKIECLVCGVSYDLVSLQEDMFLCEECFVIQKKMRSDPTWNCLGRS